MMKHVLIPGALAALASLVSAAETATISVDELERGQRGYGLTVFAGSEPQRFEVEVLGVTRNRTPELSYVLARLSGQGLETSGVFGGMSGSPVYIDGRLAGAVSFSYLFGLDAIAGITPIDAMRQLHHGLGAPPQAHTVAAGAIAPRSLPGIGWEDLVRRDFAPDLIETHLRALLPRFAGDARSALQWSAGGFGVGSTRLLERSLGHLAPGGRALAAAAGPSGAADVTGEMVPGSSVAAVLIEGDFQVAGYGTLTDRQGDEVLAFGHPVFGLGPVRIPLAASEVVTVVASRANSFKIANVGPVIGAFDQDREAGVHGRIGLTAPMIPVTVKLRGLAEREYHMQVVDVPQLTPSMMALAAYGSLEAGSFSTGTQGLDLEARFRLAGHGDLVIRQNFDDTQAGIDSILYLMSFSAFLKHNDLAEVDIESLEVEYNQVDRPRIATLVAAHTDRRVVRPGETVRLILELQPYRGESYRETVETTVPANAPNGRYVIFVGDGTTMDGVRFAIERPAPQNFEQALAFLRSFSARETLRILGLVAEPGLAIGGEVLPQLPGSVRAIFSGAAPAGTPLGLAIAHQQDARLDRPIVGYQRVDLEVRRP
jgi:hypothetical protein